MAGRKRKFPSTYIVPFPTISDNDDDDGDDVYLSEAHEQPDGQRKGPRRDDAESPGHHDAHREHGENTVDDDDNGDQESGDDAVEANFLGDDDIRPELREELAHDEDLGSVVAFDDGGDVPFDDGGDVPFDDGGDVNDVLQPGVQGMPNCK